MPAAPPAVRLRAASKAEVARARKRALESIPDPRPRRTGWDTSSANPATGSRPARAGSCARTLRARRSSRARFTMKLMATAVLESHRIWVDTRCAESIPVDATRDEHHGCERDEQHDCTEQQCVVLGQHQRV